MQTQSHQIRAFTVCYSVQNFEHLTAFDQFFNYSFRKFNGIKILKVAYVGPDNQKHFYLRRFSESRSSRGSTPSVRPSETL